MITNFFPLDARVYVRDELEMRQKRRPQYSMRAFARDLEISPSFLCEFLAGRQGLSRARALWIAEKIKLSTEQRDHFWDLLQSEFGQNSTVKRAAAIRAKDRSKNSASHMNLEHFHLVADWYSFVLLEILGLDHGPRDLSQISEILSVPVEDLQKAIERLQNLGFLEVLHDSDGRATYKVLTEITTVGNAVDDRAIQISHQQALRIHADAIDKKAFADRENLSAAFAMHKKDWPELRRQIIKAIIDVIAQYGSTDKEKDEVVYLTMQMMTMLTSEQKVNL